MLSTSYNPGPGDLLTGNVQLNLEGYVLNNFGYEVCWRQDYLNLTIGIPPTANAGNVFPQQQMPEMIR